MLFLFSISITLVGASVLLAFILFSHGEPPSRFPDRCTEPFGDEPSLADGMSVHPRREAAREGVHPSSEETDASERGLSAGKSPEAAPREPGPAEGKNGSGQSAVGPGSERSIPILRPDTPIPGLGTFERVHFFGDAGFGVLDDERDLGAVSIEGEGPRLELEGRVALTSKQIIVFDGDTVKKIPYGFIEAYRFIDSYLLIKRKNVKKRKTLLKIFGNAGDFRYILSALIPL